MDQAPSALSSSTPPARTEPAACGSSVVVQPGDSFAMISQRCYGSRTYQEWLMAHNHHEKATTLRAGETLDIAPFGTLARERVAPQWAPQVPAIAEAYAHYRNVEPGIENQLRGQRGMGSYRPDAWAKAELEAAARALRPVVARLREAGVRTQKFAQALADLERLAKGEGSFSTDYATEQIHQSFSYGIDALR